MSEYLCIVCNNKITLRKGRALSKKHECWRCRGMKSHKRLQESIQKVKEI
jgi:hypothetical protein